MIILGENLETFHIIKVCMQDDKEMHACIRRRMRMQVNLCTKGADGPNGVVSFSKIKLSPLFVHKGSQAGYSLHLLYTICGRIR